MDPDGEQSAQEQSRDWFGTTQWTDVLQAKEGEESALAGAGLARICEKYWPPIYTFLRRSGYSRPDAEDLAQGFFAHLLSHDWLRNVRPEIGRFRNFLLKSLKNYCANAHTRARAEKRGGDQLHIPIEEILHEEEQLGRGSESISPEQSFDRRWAESLMQRALNRLRKEYVESGKAGLYDELKHVHQGGSGDRYVEVGARLGLSEGAVKVAVHRLRARLSNIVRMEIQSTVGSKDAVDEELRYLRESLSR